MEQEKQHSWGHKTGAVVRISTVPCKKLLIAQLTIW